MTTMFTRRKCTNVLMLTVNLLALSIHYSAKLTITFSLSIHIFLLCSLSNSVTSISPLYCLSASSVLPSVDSTTWNGFGQVIRENFPIEKIICIIVDCSASQRTKDFQNKQMEGKCELGSDVKPTQWSIVKLFILKPTKLDGDIMVIFLVFYK